MAKAKPQAPDLMRSTIFTVPPVDPDVAYSVLRRNYAGNCNDSRVFVAKKLSPIHPPVSLDDVGQPQVRHEVLLPDDAEDRYADPRLLFEDYEANQVPHQKDLVSHVKLSARVRRLHHLWEDGRQFAMQEFVRKESMAVLMILHVPQLGKCHLHLLIPCRRFGPLGWGEFVQDLARDSGCRRVSDAWAAFRLAL